jgi:hypothetical protein
MRRWGKTIEWVWRGWRGCRSGDVATKWQKLGWAGVKLDRSSGGRTQPLSPPPSHTTHGTSACTSLLHHFSFFKRNPLLTLFIYSLPFRSYRSLLTSLVSAADASNEISEIPELQSASLSIGALVMVVLLCVHLARVRASVCAIKCHVKKNIIVIQWHKHGL